MTSQAAFSLNRQDIYIFFKFFFLVSLFILAILSFIIFIYLFRTQKLPFSFSSQAWDLLSSLTRIYAAELEPQFLVNEGKRSLAQESILFSTKPPPPTPLPIHLPYCKQLIKYLMSLFALISVKQNHPIRMHAFNNLPNQFAPPSPNQTKPK